MIAHKAKIESALGVFLHWNRAEDKKASKVYIQLSDVCLENEASRLQMARFHADWSRKFYEVMVPLITGE